MVVDELGLTLVEAEGDEVPDTGARAPLAIIVPLGGASVSSPCVKVRLRRAYAHVPVMALTAESSDLAFTEIFSAGGDEVIPSGEPDRLRTRLRALARGQQGEPLAGEEVMRIGRRPPEQRNDVRGPQEFRQVNESHAERDREFLVGVKRPGCHLHL
jgi:DNA-binding response OmpR family regulator